MPRCKWAIMSYFTLTERDAFDTLFDHAPDKLNVVKEARAHHTISWEVLHTESFDSWLWTFGLSFFQTLITFVNKHLNKLNLDVSELETQVTWFWLTEYHRRTYPKNWNLNVLRYFPLVCRWRVPGLTDGTPRRILCAPL